MQSGMGTFTRFNGGPSATRTRNPQSRGPNIVGPFPEALTHNRNSLRHNPAALSRHTDAPKHNDETLTGCIDAQKDNADALSRDLGAQKINADAQKGQGRCGKDQR